MSETKREYWSRRIAEQEASGQAVRTFCRGRKLGEQSFYQWRKRLRENPTPVRFALLETKAGSELPAAMELVLTTGERLLIGNGVNAAVLRLVLDAVRG